MFVLGVDPGLSRCGYGIVERGARQHRAIAAGVVRTDSQMSTPDRLAELQGEIRRIICEFRPGVVALERVLFQTNVQTAMGVGQASGIVMAEAINAGCEVVEYSPNEVKSAIAGDGAADKSQIEQMVRLLLGVRVELKPVDAADALGVALCHLAQSPVLVAGQR